MDLMNYGRCIEKKSQRFYQLLWKLFKLNIRIEQTANFKPQFETSTTIHLSRSKTYCISRCKQETEQRDANIEKKNL